MSGTTGGKGLGIGSVAGNQRWNLASGTVESRDAVGMLAVDRLHHAQLLIRHALAVVEWCVRNTSSALIHGQKGCGVDVGPCSRSTY